MAVSCKIHWELQSKAHQERLLLCRYLSSPQNSGQRRNVYPPSAPPSKKYLKIKKWLSSLYSLYKKVPKMYPKMTKYISNMESKKGKKGVEEPICCGGDGWKLLTV